jgi:NADH dehydrogenase
MKRICVVGGGFAGVKAAQHLEEAVGGRRSVEVVLVSDASHFTYTPLLPGVAAGAVAMRTATTRLGSIFSGDGVRLVRDRVVGFDLKARRVVGEREQLEYDALLVAVGSDPDFQGVAGLREVALPCRTAHDAVRIKSRVVSAFRRAARGEGSEARALTFVIAGGGCCGVELACELASSVQQALLPRLAPSVGRRFRLVLVEPQERVLARFDVRLQRAAEAALRRLGVEVVRDAVVGADAGGVALASGAVVESEHLFWAAGVRAPRWLEQAGLPVTDEGRVAVEDTLEVQGQRGVFAVGECAEIADGSRVVPQGASSSQQQGEMAAENVVHLLVGSALEPFGYRSWGELVALGRFDAAVAMGPLAWEGRAAFSIYRTLMTALAPTMTKRVALFADWSEEVVRGRDLGRLVFAGEEGLGR